MLTLVTFVSTFATVFFVPRTTRAADPTTAAVGTGGPSSLELPAPPANSPEGKGLAMVASSTGAAQVSYRFELPSARGDARPSLALLYNSQHGPGVAGMGWSLNLPSIVRKGHSGLPQFQDAVFTTAGYATGIEDDYYIDGKLLVPYTGVTHSDGPTPAPPALSATPPANLPAVGTNQWMTFVTDVFDGNRYFFNGTTWIQQTKSGHLLDLLPDAGPRVPVS